MKTFEEILAIRKANADKIYLSGTHAADTRVVVGLATCGIAAGATPVYEAFKKEVAACGAEKVDVVRTGCIGMCRLEPIVEVLRAGQPKVTYVKVSPDMVARIVREHISGGAPVKEYTVGEAK